MNGDQLLGILRAVLAAAGGWAVGKGYTDSATATAVAGALLTIATAVWTYYAHTQNAMINSVNKADNGVKVVAATASVPTVNESLK